MTPKPKNQRKKNDGKITIYPYANNKLKGVVFQDSDNPDLTITKYPLYIRVIVKQQTTSFASVSFTRNPSVLYSSSPSDLENELFEIEDVEYQLDQRPILKAMVNEEVKIVTDIVKRLNPFENDNFSIKDVVKQINRSYETVFVVIKQYLEKQMWDAFTDFVLQSPAYAPKIKVTRNLIGELKISFDKETLNTSWVLLPELRESRDWLDAKSYVWALSSTIPAFKELRYKYPLALWCYNDILDGIYKFYEKEPIKRGQFYVKDWESGIMKQNVRSAFNRDSNVIEEFIVEVDRIISNF